MRLFDWTCQSGSAWCWSESWLWLIRWSESWPMSWSRSQFLVEPDWLGAESWTDGFWSTGSWSQSWSRSWSGS